MRTIPTMTTRQFFRRIAGCLLKIWGLRSYLKIMSPSGTAFAAPEKGGCYHRKEHYMRTQTARKPYPTDVSDEAWEWIAPFLAHNAGPGRPRTVDSREIANAIFYL